MSNPNSLPKFSSRLAFILVTAGAAVGLGNVWSFTYVAGKNGGGGFVLIYLLALALVAAPVFMAELLLGRLGKASPPTSLRSLQKQSGSRLPWAPAVWLGVVSQIVILGYYSVIAGQAMHYIFVSLTGGFSAVSAEDVAALDSSFKAGPLLPLVWSGLFCAATALIVSADVRSGLERAGKLLMPALFIMLIGLVIYAALVGDFAAATNFMFGFSDITLTPRVVMEAVGQAFFTLSVGVGGIMMYGAYMGDNVRLPRAVLWIVAMDLLVAIVAGLAVFSFVFGFDVEPAAGPGLVFLTLPIAFGQLPAGSIVACIFFTLLVFAAITSAISMIAPAVQRMEESGIARYKSAWLVVSIAFFFSFLTAMSLTDWQHVFPLAALGFDGMTWFDLMREFTNNIVLPVGAFAFALMVGWGVGRDRVRAALPMEDTIFFALWFQVVRYLVPVAIAALFVYSLGL
ncbi:sodium-dependent transporter [Kordiimonas sediminis]|uniref:Sodium-dependent transporter n=1 Tax=Kordiimonas sediminis TaxID=1735581 RepID=A0A919ASA9_9PROT|nr:sodium-dependent transporter [Kordiimonas sediminis]GHF24004.1 sodium-dependent transporter [Kordiimonas sediminis]